MTKKYKYFLSAVFTVLIMAVSAVFPVSAETLAEDREHNVSITLPDGYVLLNLETAEDNTELIESLGYSVSSFKDYHKQQCQDDVKFYTNKNVGYISPQYIKARRELVDKYKVYISAAYGAGESYPHQIINKPFVGEQNSCCSQTYLAIGPFDSEDICENVCSYMRTKFFRFMVMLKKNAQHAMRGVYELVPLQDFSKSWTDEELYKKYSLTQDEIDFIENMIKEMK